MPTTATNIISQVDASVYLQDVLRDVEDRYQGYIDYAALSGITILSGADTNNPFEAILKIAMACERFPVVDETGKLTFIQRPTDALAVSEEVLQRDLSLRNDREMLPKYWFLFYVNNWSFATSREEFASRTGQYAGSSFDPPFEVWCPKPGEYYNDIIVELDDQDPGEDVYLYRLLNGCLGIYRENNIFGEITARAKGYKQEFNEGWTWITTLDGDMKSTRVYNYCIEGSTAAASVKDWMHENLLLFRHCALQTIGDLRLRTADKIQVPTQYGTDFAGLITSQSIEYDGALRYDVESYGGSV